MRNRSMWIRSSISALMLLFLFITSGCGGGGKEAGEQQGTPLPSGDTATAAGAYAACRGEISRLLSSGGLLSEVVGKNVDAKGSSASWDFIVLGPEREGTTLKEHHIHWNKGKVDASAVYDRDTLGYENSPAYSHYFHSVEEGWEDSPGIAEVYVKRYPEDKHSLGTLEMRLRYIRDPGRGLEGTYWKVVREAEQRGMPHALFDAGSGDFVGEIELR